MDVLLVALLAVAVVLLVFLVARQSAGRAPLPPPSPLLDPETLLAPVREQMSNLQRALNETRQQAAESQGTMLEQLRQVSVQNVQLYEQGKQLGLATTQISTALQGTGVAGDWGELQLRRTVELAGLTENVSFVDQEHITTLDGAKRPDIIVNLPNGRRIVIDAKAPLVDFENSPDASKKQADALAAHVKALAGRNYSGIVEGSIDFVVLFVPTEGIMATALGERPALSEEAIRQRILLATPMTLLAMLRAVEYGWRQVAQAENAAQIAKEGGELWDRLATFVDHFNKVGSGLKTAIDNFNAAAGSLERTVRPQAKRMRELGVSTNKELHDTPELSQSARSVTWGE
jgi:DNA recombination protein RmuC